MSVLEIIAIICALFGIVGSIVPGLPGPPVSWIGILLVYVAGTQGKCEPISTTTLLIWLGVVTLVTVIDYVVPAWFTKMTGGHKQASTGAVIGLFVGLLVPPIGMILGALIGAFIGEYAFAQQSEANSLKAALGAFLGFITGTGLKIITTAIIMYQICKYIF